jgi:hypothetical protein
MGSFFWDVVPSVAAYYGLRMLGADPYVALLGGTGRRGRAPALRPLDRPHL